VENNFATLRCENENQPGPPNNLENETGRPDSLLPLKTENKAKTETTILETENRPAPRTRFATRPDQTQEQDPDQNPADQDQNRTKGTSDSPDNQQTRYLNRPTDPAGLLPQNRPAGSTHQQPETELTQTRQGSTDKLRDSPRPNSTPPAREGPRDRKSRPQTRQGLTRPRTRNRRTPQDSPGDQKSAVLDPQTPELRHQGTTDRGRTRTRLDKTRKTRLRTTRKTGRRGGRGTRRTPRPEKHTGRTRIQTQKTRPAGSNRTRSPKTGRRQKAEGPQDFEVGRPGLDPLTRRDQTRELQETSILVSNSNNKIQRT